MQPKSKLQSSDLSLDGLEGILNSQPSKQDAAISIDEQDWTVEETSRALGLSRGAVIRRLEDGILTGYRVKRSFGWVWRVKPSWVQGSKTEINNAPLEQVRTSTSNQSDKNSDILSAMLDPADSGAQNILLESNSTANCDESTINISALDNANTALEPALLSDALQQGGSPLQHVLADSHVLDFSCAPAQPAEESIHDSSSERAASEKTTSDKERGYVEVFDVCEESLGSMSLSSESFRELVELKAKLQLTEMRFQEANNKLDTAHQKIGYLEAKLESSQEQIRLLGDSQISWWKKLQSLFRAKA